MTEAELTTLFHAHVDSIVTLLFGYFSVTSAFLVASYLAAGSFPRVLTAVVIALYSLTAISLIGYCERHATLLMAIRAQLRSQGVTWHTSVSEPEYILPILTYTIVVSMILIYVASIWYHYYAKRNSQ